MLEKIGLPAKPSLRGNTWVIDASHCQGCSSQFTFINRKHHCRRCGGIFCGSCTQQRMVLRGQGDSPVRICEPCKRLEEASRFEIRYGHKNKASKGGSRYGSKKDEDILRDILGNEDRIEKIGASSSSFHIPVEGGDTFGKPSSDLNGMSSTATTPEDLRQQAVTEKNKYQILKAEGKSEEALRAFKRGKELERQAAALEITFRKNRKKALSSSTVDNTQQIKDDRNLPADKNRLPGKKSGETDDLFSELKDLGWSDQDLRDAEKKPGTLSVEGELSSLLKVVSQKPKNEKLTDCSDKSEVIAHKKRALELKRAGNLAEAKEELKRAKILEKKIEEEELLGGADDSDDELMSLIQSMDGDEHDCDSSGHKLDLNFDYSHFTGVGYGLAVDGNLDVTDEDMYDSEINSALKSLGWVEDNTTDPDTRGAESIATEIQSLKRQALDQKRAGNSAEALTVLKKAKLLEKELESCNIRGVGEPVFSDGPIASNSGLSSAPKSKLEIQKQLLAVKRKALTLRREGKLDESAEELEKAKALEDQLEDMNKVPPIIQPSLVNRPSHNNEADSTGHDTEDQEDVTDQDLHDPAYLSLLKNLGWEDEDNADIPSMTSQENDKPSKHSSDALVLNNEASGTSSKSKSDIQRELLALKRKALAVRRQGETEEADQILKMAKSLEEKLHESEEATQRDNNSPKHNNTTNALQNTESSLQVEHSEKQATDKDPVFTNPEKKNLDPNQQEILGLKKRALALKREGKLAEAMDALRQAKLLEKPANSTADKDPDPGLGPIPTPIPSPVLSGRDRFKLQQESLGHKRNALRLRREGRTAEADSEFELAKAIEARLQEAEPSNSSFNGEPKDDVGVEDFLDPQLLSMLQSIGLGEGPPMGSQGPGRLPELDARSDKDGDEEKRQLAERIKGEKVKAVNLKRSGKQAEALDALRRAKLYERKLQSLT